MARPCIFVLVVVVFVVLKSLTPATALRRCSKARAFLETACRPTRYPQLCVETLMGSINQKTLAQYHNPRELAQLALTASLARAHRARSYMSHMVNGPKGMEQQAVSNCMDQISNSMEQIGLSIRELRRINEKGSSDEFIWHSGNVMTWTSAALTDQNSCLDTFPGGARVQAAVRGQLADVARLTSNALALVNRFLIKHSAKRMTP